MNVQQNVPRSACQRPASAHAGQWRPSRQEAARSGSQTTRAAPPSRSGFEVGRRAFLSKSSSAASVTRGPALYPSASSASVARGPALYPSASSACIGSTLSCMASSGVMAGKPSARREESVSSLMPHEHQGRRLHETRIHPDATSRRARRYPPPHWATTHDLDFLPHQVADQAAADEATAQRRFGDLTAGNELLQMDPRQVRRTLKMASQKSNVFFQKPVEAGYLATKSNGLMAANGGHGASKRSDDRYDPRPRWRGVALPARDYAPLGKGYVKPMRGPARPAWG